MAIELVFETHARTEDNEQGRATWWGLEHLIGGVPLETLLEKSFAWQEGWEYRL